MYICHLLLRTDVPPVRLLSSPYLSPECLCSYPITTAVSVSARSPRLSLLALAPHIPPHTSISLNRTQDPGQITSCPYYGRRAAFKCWVESCSGLRFSAVGGVHLESTEPGLGTPKWESSRSESAQFRAGRVTGQPHQMRRDLHGARHRLEPVLR